MLFLPCQLYWMEPSSGMMTEPLLAWHRALINALIKRLILDLSYDDSLAGRQ